MVLQSPETKVTITTSTIFVIYLNGKTRILAKDLSIEKNCESYFPSNSFSVLLFFRTSYFQTVLWGIC